MNIGVWFLPNLNIMNDASVLISIGKKMYFGGININRFFRIYFNDRLVKNTQITEKRIDLIRKKEWEKFTFSLPK